MPADRFSLHFVRTHPADASRVLDALPPDQVAPYLARLPAAETAMVISMLSPGLARRLLERMEPERLADVSQRLPVDLLALLLRRMDREARKHALAVLPERIAMLTRRVLRFTDGTVGAIMDPHTETVMEGTTVGEVVSQIKKSPAMQRNRIYIIDSNHRLTGTVDMRQLLTAAPGDSVRSVGRNVDFQLSPRMSIGSVEFHQGWRAHAELPVVDQDGRLLGALTQQSLIDEIGGDLPEPDASGLTDAVLAVAETVWDTWAGVFIRDPAETEGGSATNP